MSAFLGQVARRRYRLGDGYGPSTLPQGNGAPAPPGGAAVLFDWDPSWNPYQDRVSGIAFSATGTAPTLEVTNGLVGMTFGGAGALQSATSPFAALSDLTGGVSMYVVCERTDAAVAQDGLICLDDNDGTTSNANHLVGTWDGGDTVSCSAYDGAGTSTIDSQAGAVRNTVEILSYHATTTARTAKIDGTGSAESSGTTRDPGSLARVTIGAYTLFVASGATSFFTGRIYRVLIVEGAYNAAMLAYLQGLYPQPVAVGPPAAGLERWWSASTPLLSAEGDDVVYTASGTAYTTGTAHGLDAIKLATGSFLQGASPTGVTDDSGSFTLYMLMSGTIGGESYANVLIDSIADQYIALRFTTPPDEVSGNTSGNDSGAVGWTDDTALVVALEFNSTAGTFRVLVNGTASTTADPFFSSPTWAYHSIGYAPGWGGTGSMDTAWLMDALIYSDVYNSDVNDWLLGRTS